MLDLKSHVCDQRIDSVSANGVGGQRWDRDNQSADGCHQCLIDAFGQIPGSGGSSRRGDLLKGEDHTGDGSQQPDHRGDVADHAKVFDSAH